MITGVEIRGFKCLHDVKVDDLRAFNVLIGPNDSGKSSFLQALGLVHRSASESLCLQILDEERSGPEVYVKLAQSPTEWIASAELLADERSRLAAFGEAVDVAAIEDHPDPKSLWRSHAHRWALPKGRTRDEFEDDQRLAAWGALRSERVREACPDGFGPLARDVDTLVGLFRPPGTIGT